MHWFNSGVEAYDKQDYGQAALAYQTALTFNPSLDEALLNLGHIHVLCKNYQVALEITQKCVEVSPKWGLAWFNLACIMEMLKMQEAAVSAYRTSSSLMYIDSNYNLALILEERGKKQEALRYWKRYLSCDSSSVWARHASKRAEAINAELKKGWTLCKSPIRIGTRSADEDQTPELALVRA